MWRIDAVPTSLVQVNTERFRSSNYKLAGDRFVLDSKQSLCIEEDNFYLIEMKRLMLLQTVLSITSHNAVNSR